MTAQRRYLGWFVIILVATMGFWKQSELAWFFSQLENVSDLHNSNTSTPISLASPTTETNLTASTRHDELTKSLTQKAVEPEWQSSDAATPPTQPLTTNLTGSTGHRHQLNDELSKSLTHRAMESLMVGVVPTDRESLLNVHLIEHGNTTDAVGQRLEFVHIPKTGGSAVEVAGAQAGIPWSLCHHKPAFGALLPIAIDNMLRCPNFQPQQYELLKNDKWCGVTHVPPCFYTNAKIQSFYDGAVLFAIVRDPYERIISEYLYREKFLFNERQRKSTPNLNQWVEKMLRPMTVIMGHTNRSRHVCQASMPRKYFSINCHLTPQYDYIYANSRSFDKRPVKHVIHFEHLEEDFPRLMQMYGLNVTLPPKQRDMNVSDYQKQQQRKSLSVASLTEANRLLIQTVYRDDFLVFGYKM